MTFQSYLLLLAFSFSTCLSPALIAQTHIYLLAGQSNMMGKTTTSELPEHYKKTPKNVTFYYQGRQRQLADDNYFGPEVGFAHQISKALPHDQHIIIKYVASGSYISEWAPEQSLYRGMLRQFTLLPLPKPKEKATTEINSIIWMQGESDCRRQELAQVYGNRLSRFVNTLRNDIKSPNSLFIIGAVNPQNPGFPAVDEVRAQQLNVHKSVPNTQHVETQDLATFDNTHFNTEGLLELGKRFAASYIDSLDRPQHENIKNTLILRNDNLVREKETL